MWSSLRRPSVALFDRLYRFLHGLDNPRSELDPMLRIEIRRSHRTRRLADGTVIDRGDRIGVLHIDNDRVRAFRVDGTTPTAVGLEFARAIIASLTNLARLAQAGGPYDDIAAFSATTIFPRIRRLGFDLDPGDCRPRRIIGAYQQALLAYLNPSVASRQHRYGAAERLWISRARLIARYGEHPDTREVPALLRRMAG